MYQAGWANDCGEFRIIVGFGHDLLVSLPRRLHCLSHENVLSVLIEGERIGRIVRTILVRYRRAAIGSQSVRLAARAYEIIIIVISTELELKNKDGC